ncbi:MAG: CRTAC1 family protein [Phycisphaerae bacterium]|nr:CRTAC1 family protein [Phycisphaerae bacterium]
MTSPPDHDHEHRLPETQATAAEAAAADARVGRAVGFSIALVAVVAIIAGAAWWFTRPAAKTVVTVKPPVGPSGARELPPGAIINIPFIETALQYGLNIERVNGATGEKLLPETMGGGVAIADFDGDGTPDLLLINGSTWPWVERTAALPPTSRIFLNRGAGKFTEATNRSGIDIPMMGMGVAVADYDGDGRADVFISALGQDRLFRNVTAAVGIPRFEDVTAAALPVEDRWGTSAGFFDYDRDGDLDLFVCNYVEWSPDIDREVGYTLTGIGRSYGPPTGFAGADCFLWQNQGDGTFQDVSKAAGIEVANAATGKPIGKALGVTFVDADGDGYLDIAVANDGVVNCFFRNRGVAGPDAGFEEIGAKSGFAFDRGGAATGAMGIDAAWFRNDGRLGIAIGNFANEMSSLYVAEAPAGSAPSGTPGEPAPIKFSDDAIPEGLGPATRRALTFGVLFLDADLDGWDDYYQANGHIEEEINRVYPSQQFQQPGQLFRNIAGLNPDGPSFVELPAGSVRDIHAPIVGRGAAYADMDGDGDLDLVVTQPTGPVSFLQNQQATRNQWIRLKLIGPGLNRDAIGAVVDLVEGGRVRRKQVMPTRSYLSSVELTLTFGLGPPTGTPKAIEAVRIRWPDGTEQIIDGATLKIDSVNVIPHAEAAIFNDLQK